MGGDTIWLGYGLVVAVIVEILLRELVSADLRFLWA